LKFGTRLGAAHPALRGLMAEGVPAPSKIKTFLETHSFPLADRGASTFLFHGNAERVALCHWIHGLPGDPPFRRLANTNLWFLVLELPEGSPFEYKLAVTRNGEANVVRDPLNPLVARDPFGANSVCRAYGYTEPDWSQTHSTVPRGTLQKRATKSRHLPGRRRWTLERELPLVSAPDGRILAGASLGAMASLHAAARSPGFFGGLLLQSGSFFSSENEGRSRGPRFDAVGAFIDRFRSAPIRAEDRVFLSCGEYEPPVHENRAMLPVLQDAGMEVRYMEARDGHNWQNWRNRLQEGLSWLFPRQASLRAESASAEEGR